MKRVLIIIANVIIIAAILTFVALYSGFYNRESYQRQIDNFENTTVTMEKVTENYLEGEQRICDIWARYIINRNMTLEEAAEFIRTSHVIANTSAHLIYLDTLTGLSTRPKQGTEDDYDVSYERITKDLSFNKIYAHLATFRNHASCHRRRSALRMMRSYSCDRQFTKSRPA
ncbi:MAG: hypothetical protein K6F87_02315 [Lachnospiraceae bacterium]|nr:hypothetical protein [Lachnospiraceae bacterium]